MNQSVCTLMCMVRAINVKLNADFQFLDTLDSIKCGANVHGRTSNKVNAKYVIGSFHRLIVAVIGYFIIH
jgi:hypothetical protein